MEIISALQGIHNIISASHNGSGKDSSHNKNGESECGLHEMHFLGLPARIIALERTPEKTKQIGSRDTSLTITSARRRSAPLTTPLPRTSLGSSNFLARFRCEWLLPKKKTMEAIEAKLTSFKSVLWVDSVDCRILITLIHIGVFHEIRSNNQMAEAVRTMHEAKK